MMTSREMFIIKLQIVVQATLEKENLHEAHIVAMINIIDNIRKAEHIDISFTEMTDIFNDLKKIFGKNGVHEHIKKNLDIVTVFITSRYVDFVKYEEEFKGRKHKDMVRM